MGKIVTMTFDEARKYVEENHERLAEMHKNAPEVSDGFEDWYANQEHKVVFNGLEEFWAYIDKRKAEKKQKANEKRKTKKDKEKAVSYSSSSPAVVPMSASSHN